MRAIDESAVDVWAHFAAADNVRHTDIGFDPFELASSDCSAFLDILRHNSRLFFPHLEILVFHLSRDETDPDWIASIVDVVRGRKEQGSPLKEVFVSSWAVGWSVCTVGYDSDGC